MPDDDEEVKLDIGKAEAGTKDEEEVVAAILYIPDPCERRGWRDYWIYKKSGKNRQTGFRI